MKMMKIEEIIKKTLESIDDRNQINNVIVGGIKNKNPPFTIWDLEKGVEFIVKIEGILPMLSQDLESSTIRFEVKEDNRVGPCREFIEMKENKKDNERLKRESKIYGQIGRPIARALNKAIDEAQNN